MSPAAGDAAKVGAGPAVSAALGSRRRRGGRTGLGRCRVYFFQKLGVKSTSTAKSSSRPSSIVALQTQVWKSPRPW